MANILDVFLRFKADSKDAKKKTDDLAKSADNLEKKFKGVGTAIAGAFGTAAAKSSLDYLAELNSTAERLGLTVEQLQEFRFAASQAGLAADDLDDVMQSFVERTGDAVHGTGEAAEALKALGVQLRGTNGAFKSTEELLYDVADAFVAMEDPAQRVFRAAQLFESDAGIKFLNVLTRGSEAIREMQQRARELGVVLTEDVIRKSVEARRTVSTLSQVMGQQFNRAVANLAPVITKAGQGFEWLSERIRESYDFIRGGSKEMEKDVKDSMAGIATAAKMASDVLSESFQQTQEAVQGGGRQVETQMDAAMIRLEALRAIANQDFEGAQKKVLEFNEAIRSLADAGTEPSFVLQSLLNQSAALTRQLPAAMLAGGGAQQQTAIFNNRAYNIGPNGRPTLAPTYNVPSGGGPIPKQPIESTPPIELTPEQQQRRQFLAMQYRAETASQQAGAVVELGTRSLQFFGNIMRAMQGDSTIQSQLTASSRQRGAP